MGSVGVPKATTQGDRSHPHQGGQKREWIEPRDDTERPDLWLGTTKQIESMRSTENFKVAGNYLMPKTEVPSRFHAAVCSSWTYLSNATFRLIIESNGGGEINYRTLGPLSQYVLGFCSSHCRYLLSLRHYLLGQPTFYILY